jgi:hypothetical protein
MIKQIKIGQNIYDGFEEKTTLEDGSVVWNIPTNVDELKSIAIDTINWQIGDSVKKAVGNTNVNLSASNAKGIALLAKVVNAQNPDTSSLTDLELDSYNKMVALADGGYADSELLNASLTNVSEFITRATDKVARVTQAESIDDVITILNEQ